MSLFRANVEQNCTHLHSDAISARGAAASRVYSLILCVFMRATKSIGYFGHAKLLHIFCMVIWWKMYGYCLNAIEFYFYACRLHSVLLMYDEPIWDISNKVKNTFF